MTQTEATAANSTLDPITDVNLRNIESHLKTHQKYPATRAQLIEACFDLKDFTPTEKRWFLGNLPDGTYRSADEVMAALTLAK